MRYPLVGRILCFLTMVEVERRKPTREYVKEEYQSVVSVKSEYAVYDPVKDEETEEEEGDDTITYLPTRYRAYLVSSLLIKKIFSE